MKWDIMSFHFMDFQMQIMKLMTCGRNLFRRLDFFWNCFNGNPLFWDIGFKLQQYIKYYFYTFTDQ